MMTGEVKKILIDLLTELITAHQEARAKVTDETVQQFMSVRPIMEGGSAKLQCIDNTRKGVVTSAEVNHSITGPEQLFEHLKKGEETPRVVQDASQKPRGELMEVP
ncbi:unnamed protein product [Discosporangium mesarthrocarpum]